MSKQDKVILGLHYGHDATVVLIKNGVVLEAMSEERLSRQKKHCGFPILALDYLKKKYGINTFPNVIVVGSMLEFGSDVFNTTEDMKNFRAANLKTKWYLRSVGFRFPVVGALIRFRDEFIHRKARKVSTKTKVLEFLNSMLPGSKLTFIHHHDAHAWASVLFMSDHGKKLIFTLDGAGDDASGSVSIYEKGKLEVLKRFNISDSLGLLYCAFVDILGMTRNEHEFKVMGLAPYAKASSGENVYQELRNIFSFDEKEMKFISKIDTTKATAYLLAKEFNIKYRFDSMAYGIQKLTEEMMKQLVSSYVKKYNIHSIAAGGGVFMNVKANQKILELDLVNDFTITPSCGDESLAVGAAVYGYIKEYGYQDLKQVNNIYWGSEYSNEDIKKVIDFYIWSDNNKGKVKVEYFARLKGDVIETKIAELLSNNKVIGRMYGRAEWGARALGNRSILANPSNRDNVKLINEMIKNRDFWMPFATSLKEERKKDYIVDKVDAEAPYMAITFDTTALAHKDLPAALHPYDLTSRPQVVSKASNPEYWNLITEFEKITGIGGVLNTSFNLHGEPNIENPYDAVRTFDLSGMNYLALGDYLLSKE